MSYNNEQNAQVSDTTQFNSIVTAGHTKILTTKIKR